MSQERSLCWLLPAVASGSAFRPLSRRKVLAALARHGCVVLRDTGGHTVFVCPCGQRRAPVPRHGTVTAGVVSALGRQMEGLDEGWLS